MTQQGWPERLAASVAAEVRRHRTRLGMSAQQLAEECKKLGVPIQRSVIANFENGRRTNVGVSDLLVFAAALKVSPMQLVFPAGYERSIEGLPGLTEDTYTWAAWFSGELAAGAKWPFVSGDVTAMELVRNMVPIVRDLIEAKDQLVEAREAFESVSAELRLAEAEVAAEAAEYDRLLAQREANIQARQAAENVLSPEYQQLKDEGDRLRELAEQTRVRLQATRHRASELKAKRRALDFWQDEVETDEKMIREILRELDQNGFILPEFPEELAYLAEPETKVDEAVQSRRRRARSEVKSGRE
jgi:DNA repair exonuclease SbcCD ATPase subunit